MTTVSILFLLLFKIYFKIAFFILIRTFIPLEIKWALRKSHEFGNDRTKIMSFLVSFKYFKWHNYCY